MNDTQRLDSLANYGICIAQIAERAAGGDWSYRWVCNFGIDQSIEAPTIREALDLAVETINKGKDQ